MRSTLNASCTATLLCGVLAFATPIFAVPAFAQLAGANAHVGVNANVPVPAVTPPTGAVNPQAANAQNNANAAVATTGRIGTMGHRTGINGSANAAEQETTRELNRTQGVTTTPNAGVSAGANVSGQ